MALFPNSLLRDLYKNNIDFFAKQVSRILDELYGEQADENSVLPSNSFIYHTVEYGQTDGTRVMSNMRPDTQGAVYECTIDNFGFHLNGIAQCPYHFNRYYDSQMMEDLTELVMPYLASYSYDYSMDDLGIEYWYLNGIYLRGADSNGDMKSYTMSQPFGINTNRTATINSVQISSAKQYMTVRESNNPYDTYREVYFDNTSYIDGTTWICAKIADDYNNTNYILMPSESSDSVYNIDNTYYNNTYNYNGDTVYNYYNDYGDIVFNGGGVGIAPIGGLAYVNIESILDHLIDDLNVQFNFGGDGETLPLEYAPTWEELHYTDRGSFYITPVKQIGTLPAAPDIADTIIDVSEPLSILSDGFGALLSCFDSLGVTLTLTFTFLSCLVINKLRGD